MVCLVCLLLCCLLSCWVCWLVGWLVGWFVVLDGIGFVVAVFATVVLLFHFLIHSVVSCRWLFGYSPFLGGGEPCSIVVVQYECVFVNVRLFPYKGLLACLHVFFASYRASVLFDRWLSYKSVRGTGHNRLSDQAETLHQNDQPTDLRHR